jgi:DNA-binding transcriptional LysR family regulator
MDLQELSAFLKVVDTGSFLAAADSLGMSRTTLRRRVDALESRAGVALFESTRQGVILTEAGQALASRGRIMVQEASALLASIREVGQEPAGVLRMVMPVGVPPHLVTPLFAVLRAAHPRLRVHSRFSDDPLGESLVDVDVVIHLGEDMPRGPWLSQVIMRVRERLVASKEYLRRRGTPQSIDDLKQHELFAWQAPGENACIWPTLDGATFTVEPALVATDIHFVRHCCMAGLGIGFVPDVMLPDPGPLADSLAPVLPDVVGRVRAVRATVPAALREVPKIKAVLAHIRGFLREL